MANRWEKSGNSDRRILGDSKIIADGDCSHEIKRHLLQGRKVMTNLKWSEVKSRSRVRLFATPWDLAYQAPLSMEYSRQEYWSGLAFLLHGICLTQGLNPGLPHVKQMLYCLSHQGIKAQGRKVMTNLDSILKSRDTTLPTNVHLVKTMVFLVVMYGCETWTIKRAEHQRIDAFEL